MGDDITRSYDLFTGRAETIVLGHRVTALKKHLRTDISCYHGVTGMVTNTGDAPGRNAVIRFMLIDDETEMIRSAGTTLVPRFLAGETTIFTIDPLPGDRDREYHAEIGGAYDYPMNRVGVHIEKT